MRGSGLMAGAALLTACLIGSVQAADVPVATVAGRTITEAELEKHVKAKLIELEQERYEALREGLEELVAKELFTQEAKARGITVEALEKAEITDKMTQPSDADVQKLYDAHKEELNNEPLDNVRPRLVEFLQQMQQGKLQGDLLSQLKSKYKTSISLRAPTVDVSKGSRPPRGNPTGPITIVEFSDYECPFCKKGEQSIQQVMKAYGEQVQLYYRDYPLPFHQNARTASLAASCAMAQGKFWEYHDKVFALESLSPDALKAAAGTVGLDQAKFNKCLDGQEFAKAVEKDIEDAQSAGVNGTPTFFINGRVLSGAQPFEAFKQIIDEELARVKGGKS